MARRRRVSRLSLVYALVILALMVGGSLWLDGRGERTMARVSEKHERIVPNRDPQGGWTRRYELGVAFTARDAAPAMATVEVSRERFDALRRGDPVEIRYLPAFPLFARTTDRSTAAIARDLVSRLLGIPILLWAAGGGTALWIAARLGTVPSIVIAVAWAAAAFPLLFGAPAATSPAGPAVEARVEEVTLVTKSPSRRGTRRHRSHTHSVRRLAVPYQVIELRIAMPGRTDSVLAVDAVDSGSVPGLAVGAALPVRYDPDDPREARLTQGTRSFMERNRYHFRVPALALCALGLAAAIGAGRRPASQRGTPVREFTSAPGVQS